MKMEEKELRKKRSALTKEWLQSVGIELDDRYSYMHPRIYRTKRGKRYEIHPTLLTKKHKYGLTQHYLVVGFSANGKSFTTTLSRLVYCWYHGDIPEGWWDIDHIDGDTMNNMPDNLQLITHSENIKKRRCGGANQYRNGTNWDKKDNVKRG